METRRIILPSTAIVVSAALILGGGTTAQAAQTDQSSRDIACQSSVLQDHGVDVDLLCKIVEIGDFLEFAQDGKSIAVTLTDDDLSERFGFTPTQITDLHAILNGSYQPHQPVAKLYQDRAARFYISNDDLKAGTFAILATAASSSPEALAAAMVGLSSVIGGPVGTALGLGVSALGMGFFAALAMKITGAMVQGKGVAFYPQWDFPPLRVEIE